MLNNFKVTKTYFKIIYWHFLHVFNLCHYIVKINRIIFKTLWICSENSGIGRRVKKVQMPWDTADVQCKQSLFTYLAIQKVTSKAFCFLTTSNTLKHCFYAVFLFQSFLVLTPNQKVFSYLLWKTVLYFLGLAFCLQFQA